MRSGSRHRGEAGGGWFGFPPLLATDGRIYKGDCDMRTGANFARGSCRALKWMVLLGVLSVLGSAQAAAQPPRIESASHEGTETPDRPDYEVDIKMSRDVFFTGTNPNELLAADFALYGGNIGPAVEATTPLRPIRIDGLALTIGAAHDEFTLVFRENLATLEGTAANPLLLTYGQDDDPLVQIHSESREAFCNPYCWRLPLW